MESDSILSRIGDKFRVTLVLKVSRVKLGNFLSSFVPQCPSLQIFQGLVNSGKSTILKVIFPNVSISRETSCQIIATEGSSELAAAVSDSSSKRAHQAPDVVYSNHATFPMLPKKERMQLSAFREAEILVPPFENLFRRFTNTSFRLVKTNGFDDPMNDDANKRWFQQNTKFADVLFFVTDATRCLTSKVEQNLFRETVRDLLASVAIGKVIPVIVIINKVDDPDDEAVAKMVVQCKAIVVDIMAKLNAGAHPVEVVELSAQSALCYRMFMQKWNFDGMDQRSVSRIADFELGRQGKKLANDLSTHATLATLLKNRIQEDSTQWKSVCGISKLVDVLDRHVSAKVGVSVQTNRALP